MPVTKKESGKEKRRKRSKYFKGRRGKFNLMKRDKKRAEMSAKNVVPLFKLSATAYSFAWLFSFYFTFRWNKREINNQEAGKGE
jgi:hypothetical protein